MIVCYVESVLGAKHFDKLLFEKLSLKLFAGSISAIKGDSVFDRWWLVSKYGSYKTRKSTSGIAPRKQLATRWHVKVH